MGAFMRTNGIDGVLVQGKADKWTRIHIQDGKVQLLDAEHLVGKDTWETEDAVKEETEGRCSVYSIGPAGENLVRFAAIVGDRGHVAAHNGVGAVMGSKKIKCISAVKGDVKPRVLDPETLVAKAKELTEFTRQVDPGLLQFGTNAGLVPLGAMGAVPMRNYTTNVWPEGNKYVPEYMRERFKSKPSACWACSHAHCRISELTEGKYTGFVGEEPEYEGTAEMGPLIGMTEPAETFYLCNVVDRLGFDVNESGYMIAWLMECYERGYITKDDLDGVELKFEDDALERIAALAIERNTGARGLRSIMEELMLDIMFDVPSRDDVGTVVITADAVDRKAAPKYIFKPKELSAAKTKTADKNSSGEDSAE